MSNQPNPEEYLRHQAEEIGNLTLSKWGRWAIARWKESDRDKYEGLLKAGMLQDSAILAQEQAKYLCGELVEKGMDPNQAREIALATFILTETDEPEEWEMEAAEAAENAEIEKYLIEGMIPRRPRRFKRPRSRPTTT